MAALRADALRSFLNAFSGASQRTFCSSAALHGSTVNQRMRKDHLTTKQYYSLQEKFKRLSANQQMDHCPIRKGVVQRCYVQKPKKPNSALRKVARIRLTTGATIIAHIPGEGHNLQDHAVVLVRHGGYRDLGHVHHKVIRGALDCAGVVGRVSSRTKYGAKKPKKVVSA